MSKKQLLSESEIRRFMKLANLEPLAKGVISERWHKEEELEEADVGAPAPAPAPAAGAAQEELEEAGITGDDSPPEAVEKQPMDDSEEGEEKIGGLSVKPETIKKVKELIAADAEVDPEEIDLQLDVDGEEGEDEEEDDMDMEMSDEEDDEEDDEEEEEVEESLSEDALVETVLARVTARLVAEAAKKDPKKKMKHKKAKKHGAHQKEEEVEESKKAKLKEATSAEGGGPLLKQGKNKYDVYKGHADMTMAKGEKGGKGGHSLETLSAKAEHTVTHGGKNLATLGGNKKKV